MGDIINNNITAADLPAEDKAMNLLVLAALFTVNIGIINLLPIPALDGGRCIFIIIEAIIRKPVPAKYEGWIHSIGFILLIGLMIFVFFNDIIRLTSR
jgi:regulator of sigma E protease